MDFTCPLEAFRLYYYSRSCHSHLPSNQLIPLTWASPHISPPAPHFLISLKNKYLLLFHSCIISRFFVAMSLVCLLTSLPAYRPASTCLQAYLYVQLTIKSINYSYLLQPSTLGCFYCSLTITCLTSPKGNKIKSKSRLYKHCPLQHCPYSVSSLNSAKRLTPSPLSLFLWHADF